MGIAYATDRDGTRHELQGQERRSLMELPEGAGPSIQALCGSHCQCATCHVFLEQPWLGMLKPLTNFEPATLEGEGSETWPDSRLSRRINWREELDGIVLTVAPRPES